MKPEPTLIESFEDARFAILMDEYLQAEGERLEALNRALRSDPEAAVPEKSVEKCLVTIQEAFRKQKRAAARVRWKKVVKILPLAVLLAAVLLTTSMAAIPEFRVAVLNFFQSDEAPATVWSFYEDQSYLTLEDLESDYAAETPQGFFLEEYYENPVIRHLFYVSESGSDSYLNLEAIHGDNSSVSVNNEGYIVKKEVLIHGNSGIFYSDGTKLWMVWSDQTIPAIYVVDCVGLSEDAFMRFAESVTYLGPSE